jgi:hypothetical protein
MREVIGVFKPCPPQGRSVAEPRPGVRHRLSL